VCAQFRPVTGRISDGAARGRFCFGCTFTAFGNQEVHHDYARRAGCSASDPRSASGTGHRDPVAAGVPLGHPRHGLTGALPPCRARSPAPSPADLGGWLTRRRRGIGVSSTRAAEAGPEPDRRRRTPTPARRRGWSPGVPGWGSPVGEVEHPDGGPALDVRGGFCAGLVGPRHSEELVPWPQVCFAQLLPRNPARGARSASSATSAAWACRRSSTVGSRCTPRAGSPDFNPPAPDPPAGAGGNPDTSACSAVAGRPCIAG